MHRHLVAIVVAVGLSLSATTALAGTPDGKTPSREDACSLLKGAAYGTCNAYCEAQDCDSHARGSCPALRRAFKKLTGTTVFPCDRLPCGYERAGAQCGGACPNGKECVPVRREGAGCNCKPMLIGIQAPAVH